MRLEMEWRDVLFASWPVDPAALAETLPDPLDVDTRDGRAWLSVVPFVMADVRPAGVPRTVAPTFGELNLRTYVTHEGERGIYFYSLDASDPLGVALARVLYGLPYYFARTSVSSDGDRTWVSSRRLHPGASPLTARATYAPDGEPEPATGLTEWLVERYRFYTAGSDGVRYADVEHAPWTVTAATATLDADDLFVANGITPPDGDPRLVYSPGVEVTASGLRTT